MELISSKDNTLIKRFKGLSLQKKHREAEQAFVIEGARLVSDAVGMSTINADRYKLDTLLVTCNAMEKYQEQFLKGHDKTRLFFISDELSRYLSDTEQPQGIFGICKRLNHVKPELKCGEGYVILNEVQDPGNVGTILRTSEALGVKGVYLCGCCDVYSPKVIRASMGALLRLEVYSGLGSLEEVTDLFRSNGLETYAAVVDDNAISIEEAVWDYSRGVAIVIGNEGNGLSGENRQCCDKEVTIPMISNANSLNAAIASGILIWEMAKNRGGIQNGSRCSSGRG